MKPVEEQDIVEKLLIRAEIRQSIRSENDRIAELLKEAAREIRQLRYELYQSINPHLYK